METCPTCWKKWPTGQREFDIDLDGVSLSGFK
jgi:hypothetical protein